MKSFCTVGACPKLECGLNNGNVSEVEINGLNLTQADSCWRGLNEKHQKVKCHSSSLGLFHLLERMVRRPRHASFGNMQFYNPIFASTSLEQ